MRNERLRAAKLQRKKNMRKDYKRRYNMNHNAPAKRLEDIVVPILKTPRQRDKMFAPAEDYGNGMKSQRAMAIKLGEKKVPQYQSRKKQYSNKNGALVHFAPYPAGRKFMQSKKTRKANLISQLDRVTSPAITT